MFAVQQPLIASSFNDVMETPAWRSLPTWYLVATNDEAIPLEAQRMFAQRMGAAVVEAPSSHVATVSHAPEVVGLIKTAAAAQERQGRPRQCGSRSRQTTQPAPGQVRPRALTLRLAQTRDVNVAACG
jgi:hypothetical protein